MKKRKILQFSKFILEKYGQEIPEEETNVSNKKLEDEFDEIINGQELKKDEVQDDDEIENDDDDDDNIDNLVKEYQLLEKKFKLKSNDRIYNKRK